VAGLDAVDLEQAKPVDSPSQLACADAVVTTQGIEALRRQRHAPRFGNGDLHLQERAPNTVAIKARRSASISSGVVLHLIVRFQFQQFQQDSPALNLRLGT
jgi:hypothetical protein